MSIDYAIGLDCDLSEQDLLQRFGAVASELFPLVSLRLQADGGRWGLADIGVCTTSDYMREQTLLAYGVEMRIELLLSIQDEDEDVRFDAIVSVARALWRSLRCDLAMIFNGDYPVLCVKASSLILNKSWQDWDIDSVSKQFADLAVSVEYLPIR